MPYSLGKQIGSDSAVAYYHKTPQITARIVRTVGNALICRSFFAVGTAIGNRPPGDGYRPPSQVPTAYRPPRNVAFCRYFVSMVDAAVDAGDVFRTFEASLDHLGDDQFSAVCGAKVLILGVEWASNLP